MKNIKTIRVYNLVDSKGNRLRLELGIINNYSPDYSDPISHSDKGYRWRFIGENIPMPVRSMYWFNGFPESIMLSWLKGNGWYPHTRVEMCNGYAEVFELPNGDETSCEPSDEDRMAFINVIRDLVRNGKRITAIHTYRYAQGGTLGDAYKAIKEICDLA